MDLVKVEIIRAFAFELNANCLSYISPHNVLVAVGADKIYLSYNVNDCTELDSAVVLINFEGEVLRAYNVADRIGDFNSYIWVHRLSLDYQNFFWGGRYIKEDTDGS